MYGPWTRANDGIVLGVMMGFRTASSTVWDPCPIMRLFIFPNKPLSLTQPKTFLGSTISLNDNSYQINHIESHNLISPHQVSFMCLLYLFSFYFFRETKTKVFLTRERGVTKFILKN